MLLLGGTRSLSLFCCVSFYLVKVFYCTEGSSAPEVTEEAGSETECIQDLKMVTRKRKMALRC